MPTKPEDGYLDTWEVVNVNGIVKDKNISYKTW